VFERDSTSWLLIGRDPMTFNHVGTLRIFLERLKVFCFVFIGRFFKDPAFLRYAWPATGQKSSASFLNRPITEDDDDESV